MRLDARSRAFAAVARCGSFSAAAGELFVSQPAVSKHIASLEAELGVALVLRGGGRAVELTHAGRTLSDYVLRAEALLVNASRAVSSVRGAETGTLTVVASGVPGTYLLPPVVARYVERYPLVDVRFEAGTSGRALERVRTHAVEVAVLGGMTVPAELDAEPLVADEIVVVGPPALAGRRLTRRRLEALTWISREEGSATRAAVATARWQIGLHDVRSLDLPTWEAVKIAVARGAGIAAVSRLALELELASGALAILEVPRWRLERTISLVTARDVPLTPAAARFAELVREALAGDPRSFGGETPERL